MTKLPVLLLLSRLMLAAVDGPDNNVKRFEIAELEAQLPTMPAGPERNYFAGVMANREGHVDESIRLLTDALPTVRDKWPERAAVALDVLADDYIKSFRYADAARTYDDLLEHFAGQVDPKRAQGTKDDAGVLRLLKDAPPQTITWDGPVRLKTRRNAINSLTTDLTAYGVREPWLLDTGANFSVVSHSFAQRLGLKPLPGHGQTGSGVTGIENPLQVALVPTLQMGGATLRNVVVLILDDENLKIALDKDSYQINAIVGYPVFQAFGAITFRHDGYFEAGETAKRSLPGAHMYMKLLTPVIECGVNGKNLPFTFDTGASGSELSQRYYERFQSDGLDWTKEESGTAGAGGLRRHTMYRQHRLEMAVAERTVRLEDVPILPILMGASIDELYGNLGQDLVAGFESFTLDFSTMRFSLGTPLTN